MGAEGKYDLQLADDSAIPVLPSSAPLGEGSDGEASTPAPPTQPSTSRLASFLQALGEEAGSATAERLREEIERLEQEAGMMGEGEEDALVGGGVWLGFVVMFVLSPQAGLTSSHYRRLLSEEDYVLKQAFSALVPAFDPRPGKTNVPQIQDFDIPPPGTGGLHRMG